MPKMSGAKALVKALRDEKVDKIFGVIGGAIMPVYDEFIDSGIRPIRMSHEQGAGHAADGYARVLGFPGVCMGTSGPGATNLVTGVATAYMDSSPVIAITGQVNYYSPNTPYMIGRDAFQEIDAVAIMTPITKYVFQPKKVRDVPSTVRSAFAIAMHGRPGPVHIDLPKDVQTGEGEVDDARMLVSLRPIPEPKMDEVKKVASLLLNAQRPVILAGGGVIWSGASEELLKVAELLLAPVITTFMGKGAIPENHPLSIGVIGMHGNSVANRVTREADVILAVGTRFSDRSVGTLDTFAPEARIIHIDIDRSEIGKNVSTHIGIVGDAKRVLGMLYDTMLSLAKKSPERWEWVRKLRKEAEAVRDEREDTGFTAKKVLRTLRKIVPGNAIITTEVGQNQMWASLYFDIYEPRTFLSSGGLGTMGSGFPMAIGAKVARPDRFVMDIAGDGSFKMNEKELATTVLENIPVTVVILNNHMLGMVAQWQRMFYDYRYIGVELENIPDFEKLAKAYGAEGFRVDSPQELEKAIKFALGSEVSVVMDVSIHPEEDVLPFVPPGKGLHEVIEK